MWKKDRDKLRYIIFIYIYYFEPAFILKVKENKNIRWKILLNSIYWVDFSWLN